MIQRIAVQALIALSALGWAQQSARAQQTLKSIVVPTAMTHPAEWSYTTADPGTGWEKPGFNDSAWTVGLSGFGTRKTPGGVASTEWTDSVIWLRRTMTLPNVDSLDGLNLFIHHDEDAEVYVNGTLIWQDSGYTVDYISVPLTTQARAAFKTGANLVAVHCLQHKGGQYIDLGFETNIFGAPAVLMPDSRLEPQTWKYTTEDPATSNWSGAGFNDAGWSVGKAGFGAPGTPGLVFNTAWKTSDIWMRRVFTMDSTPYNHFYLTVQHDEDVSILINGKLVLQRIGYITRYLDIDITDAVKGYIKPGANVVAVWCHQTLGGQFIDVGLQAVLTEPPVPVAAGKPGSAQGNGAARRADARMGAPAWGYPGSYRLFSADGRAVSLTRP